jgi:tryptophanyl-tRNA synthetase
MNGRIFSGVQPTGNLHLGNYLGAIRNWVDMQNNYECIFCIVDMHAITVPQEPEALLNATREVTAAYIACGVNPDTATIFHQSAVSVHAELAWILNCFTPLGWLNRMTQFKDKAGKNRDNALLGLYSYPVLMAADILGYKATHVPVGEDQKQHLELARDIAGAFNRRYGVEFFPLPEPVIAGHATRVMSLQDGTKKMSKSDPSEKSRIALTDDADTIAKKIKKAKSDMVEGLSWEPETRPEAANLINIYSVLSGESREAVTARYATSGFAPFKKDLADVAVEHLAPITAEMRRLLAEPAYIDGILRKGADNANGIAQKVLAEVKDIVGFLRV